MCYTCIKWKQENKSGICKKIAFFFLGSKHKICNALLKQQGSEQGKRKKSRSFPSIFFLQCEPRGRIQPAEHSNYFLMLRGALPSAASCSSPLHSYLLRKCFIKGASKVTGSVCATSIPFVCFSKRQIKTWQCDEIHW